MRALNPVLAFLGFLLLPGLTPSHAASPPPLSADQALQRIGPSTVLVLGNCPGSGWVVDHQRRLIITSMVTIAGRDQASVIFPVSHNGRLVTDAQYYGERAREQVVAAKVLYVDGQRRLALIQAERMPDTAQAIPLANAEPPQGATIFAIGDSTVSGHFFAVHSGTVDRVVARRDGVRLIRSTLNTKPNDWGGPVVDDHGRLVGVIASAYNDDLPKEMPRVITAAEILSLLRAAKHPLPATARSSESAPIAPLTDEDIAKLNEILELLRSVDNDEARR